MAPEWTIYDSEREDFDIVTATTWKKALLRASKLGYVAREVNHIRPRTGTPQTPTTEEFEEFKND